MTKIFRTILAVDWGGPMDKRSAYVADVATRTVRRLPGGPWTLQGLLETAATLPGPVLVAIDAVLGLPQIYFDVARRAVPTWTGAECFGDWLRLAHATPGAFDPVATAAAWSPARPFFRVPKGRGALSAYWNVAGGKLLRAIDVQTGGKSMFVVSGIPGTVGSGTRALFMSGAPLLDEKGRAFGLWPFEGTLAELAARHHVTLGEMYPRLSYALGVAAEIPAPLLPVAKTCAAARNAYIDRLLTAAWMLELGVTIQDSDAARDDEDDFDALVSAAALLRAVLQGYALEAADIPDRAVEGSMLAIHLRTSRDRRRRRR